MSDRESIGDRTALMRMLPADKISELIKKAHQEWLAALDTIQDPIFMHDDQYRVTRCNLAYARLAGLPVKEVIGKRYYEVFPRRDGPLAHCRALVEGGGEGEEVHLDQGKVYLSRAAAVTDGDGDYLYSLHIMYDITERKQMEQAVREGEERLRLAFSAAHQGWFDQDVQTGKALVSREYAAMLGYDPATFETSLSRLAEGVHPEDREAVLQAFARCTETGGPMSIEFRRRTRSGDWIWLSAVAKIVEWDAQGRARRMLGVMTDITDRKRAEMALMRSETRFRSMFESLAEGVLLYDKSGVIQLCNPAAERILELSRDEVIGATSAVPAWTALREDGTPFAHDDLPVRRTLATGGALNNIVVGLQKPSGERQWLNVNSEPLFEEGAAREVVAAIVSFEDITARKLAEQRLLKLNHALKTIGDCNRTMVFAEDEQQLLRDMCGVIVESGGYRAAWIGYAEQDEAKTIRLRAHHGLDEAMVQGMDLTWADNPAGQWPMARAIRTGQPQISGDLESEPVVRRHWPSPRGAASCIAIPLKERGATIGSLNIYAHEVSGFSEDEVQMLQELADDLGFGIGTMRLRQSQEQMLKQLRRELEGTVQAVSSMVEMRDPYTAGHERRVAALASAIAEEMGLPEEQVRGIHLAGTIHDVGKIQIPAEILSKPGRLTDVEYRLIRQHPQTGYEILKNIEFPWPIAQTVLQHHERMDGSGYPNGLKGGEILLEARILAVSDVVEAMASHRPYRPGLGVDEALREIREHRGTYYDPEVADACIRLFEEKGYTLPETWAAHKAG